jgi:hypothetical protein
MMIYCKLIYLGRPDTTDAWTLHASQFSDVRLIGQTGLTIESVHDPSIELFAFIGDLIRKQVDDIFIIIIVDQ